MRIREARPDEACALSALVLRSKAHWGYDEAFLAACRDELTISAGRMTERRLVVAEDEMSGEALGVASLEGRAPDGTLGLLFVEPRVIGLGIGRALFAHVLDTARAWGFERLTIDSDPHAVDFYRALGARPVRGGGALPRLLVEPPPRRAWVRAWTRGLRTVQLGNVGEFQAQFGELTPLARRASGHYSCLAVLGSPYPAAVVLPETVPPGWVELLCRQLAWESVEVYDGLGAAAHTAEAAHATDAAPAETAPADDAPPSGLAAAILARPALTRRLRGLGLPFVPWGHTGPSGELSGETLPPGALRYESKSAANTLFQRLAPAHAAITVPVQRTAANRWEAARLLLARIRSGEGGVVKTEHGVGGSGTHVVRSVRALLPVLRALPPGPLLVEDYLTDGPASPYSASPHSASGREGTARDLPRDVPRDLTYDGLVDTAGTVHDVGAARMDVADTAYRGATVGPGAVPEQAASIALRFGQAVGLELAESGYRGWYDVDFVTAADGRLAPTEINLRLTGPSVAFMVKARLDETRGGDHLVRSLDHVPLGARLPDTELIAWLEELTGRCAGIGAVLVPSIPTAAFDPAPFVGVLLGARTPDRLDAAEALVTGAAQDLGRIFAPVDRSAGAT
ncbi:GNAT family N-acetyltransferase [Streptomyces sp. 35G-GA-8]|uniref:GNAT family N-acetyltransferase n=1 Tax=Streptomyces sp. 35G-GA-8 TaxID=2939434 RepID=UPI00201F9518|nr:GNAT family N-acetyltransferase [Streptomyces sp. 35G-GA-8]MCL7375605.1 GNAT family N-acetyltransferase [Streptomyces sp. 35G-GA-8]